MSRFTEPPTWVGSSADPVDEQFGDVVVGCDLTEASEFDAVLVGEPYDGGVISRPGAADGPSAIRESLSEAKTHHFDSGPATRIADLGDVDISADSIGAVQNEIRDVTKEVHALEGVPVFLGGGNSCTVPNVAPLLEDATVGVLNLDAHLDVREPHDGPTSGTPYRQLYERGLDGYACIGARHFETSTKYHEYVRKNGGTVVTAEEVAMDIGDAVDRAFEALEDVDCLYCSVDIDVLDAVYGGSSAPTPGGLLPRELFQLVRHVADDERVAGFEVVECAPTLDPNGRTVDVAARTVAHFLSEWVA